MLTDPLSDLLSRIRNGQMARKAEVKTPSSKLRKAVLDVLAQEGYIAGYEEVPTEHAHIANLNIQLKFVSGRGVIRKISRVSKPGRRQYSSIKSLKKAYNGLGTVILSTSKGVMSDHQARQMNVGGEVLCSLF